MTQPTLTPAEQRLLRVLGAVVPPAQREEWFRAWQAELWHRHARTSQAATEPTLATGLIRDALWLRTDGCRRALEGTPTICLATLAGLCLFAALLARLLTGGTQQLTLTLSGPLHRFTVEAPLLALVTFVTGSRRHVDRRSSILSLHRIRRQIFCAAKFILILLLAFLLAADLCEPLLSTFPVTFDLLHTLASVLIAIAGLRWALEDQDQRCKQCLVLLTSPAHVGRPSRNLLEWNGTQQLCRHGHGRLNTPELATSWCRHSQWLEPAPDRQQPA